MHALDTVAAWLLTYAVHSSLLFAGAALLASRRLGLNDLLRDTLWKTAMVGALLTATLQIQMGGSLLGPSLNFDQLAGATAAATPPPEGLVPAVADVTLAAMAPATKTRVQPRTAASPKAPRSAVELLLPDPPAATVPGAAASPAGGSWRLLLLLWLGGAAFFLARLVLSRRRFMRQVGGRRPVQDPFLLETLRRLQQRTGIRRPLRLTSSSTLCSPVALEGDEICLPERARHDLDAEQQESMLAHEVAHLARRDPQWLVLSGILESIFFFQPLHRLGRHQMRETSEYLCDEFAVRLTGRQLTLARCLARVATWLERPAQPAPVACMARLGSPLLRRVQRLMEERSPAAARTPRLRRALAVALPLAAVAFLAPVVLAQRPAVLATDAEAAAAAPTAAPTESIAMADARLAYAVAAARAAAADDPDQASNWVNEDDRGHLSISTEGEVEISEDGGSIDSISPDGHFRLEEERGGVERRLKVTPEGKDLVYRFTVDGKRQDFDADGRRWLRRSLERIEEQQERAQEQGSRMRERQREMHDHQREMRERQSELQREMVDRQRVTAENMRQHQMELQQQMRERQMEYQDQQRTLVDEYRAQMEELQQEMEAIHRTQEMEIRELMEEHRRQIEELRREYTPEADADGGAGAYVHPALAPVVPRAPFAVLAPAPPVTAYAAPVPLPEPLHEPMLAPMPPDPPLPEPPPRPLFKRKSRSSDQRP